ncbi:MAG: hypothetical protein Q8Q09_20560 [Deltaproteobacteria bacterium]|nr:hypothetical protein [Deltaproteobacteria bacterium]
MHPRLTRLAASLALVTVAAACKRPAANPAPLTAPAAHATAAPPSPQVVAAPAPTVARVQLAVTGARGCVGWSATQRAFACIEGHWGHNVDDAAWQLVVHARSAAARSDLSPSRDNMSPSAVTDEPLPAAKVAMAQQQLTTGAFVSLAAHTHDVPVGAILTIPGGSVHYTRSAARRAGRNEAPRFNERIFLVSEFALSASVEVFSGESLATGDTGPTVTVYAIDAENVAVHRLAHTNDEGVAEIEAQTWICDLRAQRCQ